MSFVVSWVLSQWACTLGFRRTSQCEHVHCASTLSRGWSVIGASRGRKQMDIGCKLPCFQKSHIHHIYNLYYTWLLNTMDAHACSMRCTVHSMQTNTLHIIILLHVHACPICYMQHCTKRRCDPHRDLTYLKRKDSWTTALTHTMQAYMLPCCL